MRIRAVGLMCLLVGVAVVVSPAHSEPIAGCGAVITEDVVLQHDIGPCVGDGLVVQGGAASIDLNGHSIEGSSGSAGVRIEGSREVPLADVRVSNGSIKGFGAGVSVRAGIGECRTSSVITVDSITVRANGSGISVFVFCGAGVNLTRNSIEQNAGNGISAGAGNRNGPIHILENRVVGNGGSGIIGSFDSVRRVDNNFVAHNGMDGIYLDDTVSSVRNNRILKNGGVGLTIHETAPDFIPHYDVSDNVADGNAAGGMIASAFPDPPGPPAGDGNSAKHNGVFQCVLIQCAANQGQAKIKEK